MPDPYSNARPYFDVAFPSSGDGFSIAGFRNAFLGLGFLDMVPLQPRAHTPADTRVMVRGRDASTFYNPLYYGDANQRIAFGSGDSPAITAPISNPRIDVLYMTPSGDLLMITGTEAATPTVPTLAPSGDTRFPICAIYNRPGQARVVNFENKDSNTGDGYIFQDLRPWLRMPVSRQGFSKSFVSGQITITSAGQVITPHNLREKPSLVQLRLVNIVAEFGWVPGDELVLSTEMDTTPNRGIAVNVDGINITLRFGATTPAVGILDSSGNNQGATNSSWRVVIRAWA